DHEMTPVVRVVVQQGVAGAVAGDDMVRLVIVRLVDLCEQADVRRRWFGRQNVLDSPRCVETFHAGSVGTGLGKVKAGSGLKFKAQSPKSKVQGPKFSSLFV